MDAIYEPDIWYYEHDNARIGPVAELEIKNRLKNRQLNGDSIVWKKGYDSWKKIKDSELKALLGYYMDEPPPLAVNNTFVWLLVLMPIIDGALSVYINSIYLSIFVIAANLIMAYLDGKQIDKAGYKNNINWLWVIILVPIYLWQRSKLVGQSKVYVWLWLVSLAISVAINVVATMVM